MTSIDPVFDAETVGTDLYLYMRQHTWIGKAGWDRISNVLLALEPTLHRWSTWRDMRPGAMTQEEAASVPSPMPFAGVGGDGFYMPPGVAPQGRRMRRRTNQWTWILALLVFVLVVLGQIMGALR